MTCLLFVRKTLVLIPSLQSQVLLQQVVQANTKVKHASFVSLKLFLGHPCELNNTYLKGSSIRIIEDKSWSECKQLCANNANCESFTLFSLISSDSACRLYSNVPNADHTAIVEGAFSGIKSCWTPTN